MRLLTQLKANLPGRRKLAALAAVASLVIVSLSVVAWAGASDDAAREPSAENVAPAPGDSGVVVSGPELSEADVDALARMFVASQAQESSTTEQLVVRTDRASAEAAVLPGSHLPGDSSPALQVWEQAPVFVEVLRGDFTLPNAPVRPGALPPHGSTLSLIIDAHTGRLSASGLTDKAPDLVALEHLGELRQVG